MTSPRQPDADRRIAAVGKRTRESFMKYAWINEVLMAGTRQLLGHAAPAS